MVMCKSATSYLHRQGWTRLSVYSPFQFFYERWRQYWLWRGWVRFRCFITFILQPPLSLRMNSHPDFTRILDGAGADQTILNIWRTSRNNANVLPRIGMYGEIANSWWWAYIFLNHIPIDPLKRRWSAKLTAPVISEQKILIDLPRVK